MRTPFVILLVLGIVLCAAPASVGQPVQPVPPAPPGAPFEVKHFTAQEYRAQSQNWSIAQDERGLMYVANNDGILQYDGAHWRLIETDANTFGRSVAADSQGTVYAGAVGDFGVLRPDSTATLRYVSLSARLPDKQQDFEDVWYTHAADDGVYFQSRRRLFRWDGDTLHSWKSEEAAFHTSFVVRGQLYVRESGRGLLRMEGDSLRLVPGGERFAGMSVYVMLPHGPEKVLVGTTRKNFLLYDGKSFDPFATEADPLLEENALYHGCALPGGEIALATLGGGVLIIDAKGRLVQVLEPDTALPDGTVNHVYPDGQGGLWMALSNQGIARAEVSSPLSRFDNGFGLKGIIYDLDRHEGTLYAATGAGLYALTEQNAGGRTRPRFQKVEGVPAAWNLLSSGGALYAAGRGGVYRVRGTRSTTLVEKKSFSLAAAGEKSGRFYVGANGGLGLLERAGGGWAFRLLTPTQSEVRSLTRTEKGGALWFSTLDGTVFRYTGAEAARLADGDTLVRPQRFDSTSGLPDGHGFVSSLSEAPIFMSKEGLYRVRQTPGDTTFYPDTTLTGTRNEHGPLRALYKEDAEAWLFYDDRVEVARARPDGTYDRSAPPPLQFPHGDVVRALIEPGGSAWISSDDQLIRYDAARAERLRGTAGPPPPPLIRAVRDAATGDMIYGGARHTQAPVEIPYRQNSLYVTFALPRYGGEAPSFYRYRLKGDENWSDWAPDPDAVLDHLYEGTYTLEMRARRADGPVSRASLTLRILPPWYRTIWAYLSYLAAGVLLAAGYRHYRDLREESRRARAQAVRHKRETEREREAREQLQVAHDRLEEANRLKENFLANTSHEFRTPLASIMGYAEVLQGEELPREQQQEFLGIIRSSGDRLLNTVDMLLEISQLRAGALHLNPSPVEVNKQVAEAVAPFREKAAEKGLTFDFAPAPAPIRAQLPAPYFRRIVENLVDNAVKFTPQGAVHVAVHDEGDDVRVVVRDTGVGMEETDPEKLFDAFKQASEGIAREYEGIGLGLTIAGRLTRLMGGSIDVESTTGEGSTFTVRLPRQPAHDTPGTSKKRTPEKENVYDDSTQEGRSTSDDA